MEPGETYEFSNQQKAEKCVKDALEALGYNFHSGTESTPKRIVAYWKYLLEPPEMIKWTTFDPDGTDQIIVISDISFSSACEHHFLPFYGKAHIAYLPGDRIVGLSKIARVVKAFAKSPQTQEYLTNKIAKEINARLNPLGVAVYMQAEHTCMACRGALAQGSVTQTSKMLGVFKDDESAKQEFFDIIKMRK